MSTAKTAAIATLVVAAAVACGVVLVQAQVVVFGLLGAIVIAEAVRPLVDALTTRMPRGAAIGVAFAIVLLGLGALWYVPIRAVIPQLLALWAALPALIATLGPHLPTSAAPALFTALVGIEGEMARDFTILSLAFVMALFWFGASSALRTAILSFTPANQRAGLDSLFAELGGRLRAYVIGDLINGAIVGIACGIGLSWMRFPYPMALAVLEGLLVAIPYVGPFFGVLIAGAVAFGLQGSVRAAEAIAIVSLAHTLEGTFVSPLIFQRRLDVDPLAVVLGTAIGGALFGIVGVVLAVPTVAVAQTLVTRVVVPQIRAQRAAQGVTAA